MLPVPGRYSTELYVCVCVHACDINFILLYWLIMFIAVDSQVDSGGSEGAGVLKSPLNNSIVSAHFRSWVTYIWLWLWDIHCHALTVQHELCITDTFTAVGSFDNVFYLISLVWTFLIFANVKDLPLSLYCSLSSVFTCCAPAEVRFKRWLTCLSNINSATCFYTLTINVWQGRAKLGFNPELKGLEEKNVVVDSWRCHKWGC